jgi:hypothetical protein
MKIFSFKTSTQQKNYWCVLFNLEMSHILCAESFFKEEGWFCQKKVCEQILIIINPDFYCIGMWDWTEVKLDLGSNISPCSDRSPLQLGIPFAHVYEHCTACKKCLIHIKSGYYNFGLCLLKHKHEFYLLPLRLKISLFSLLDISNLFIWLSKSG